MVPLPIPSRFESFFFQEEMFYGKMSTMARIRTDMLMMQTIAISTFPAFGKLQRIRISGINGFLE
jgi:hypothetical protein